MTVGLTARLDLEKFLYAKFKKYYIILIKNNLFKRTVKWLIKILKTKSESKNEPDQFQW